MQKLQTVVDHARYIMDVLKEGEYILFVDWGAKYRFTLPPSRGERPQPCPPPPGTDQELLDKAARELQHTKDLVSIEQLSRTSRGGTEWCCIGTYEQAQKYDCKQAA